MALLGDENPEGGIPPENDLDGLAAGEIVDMDGMDGMDDMEAEEEDEFDDQHPHDVIRDFGAHPMMEKIHQTYFEQLKRKHERVVIEKREKENELGMLKGKREQAGVELYGKQQHLARLQMALENLHNNHHTLAETRAQEEQVLGDLKEKHATIKAAHSEKQKSLLKSQAEMDALNETVNQVERYNDEMKSEIALTRRATYKAESAVTELEKQKHDQDLYIDNLNQQRKKLEESIALHKAQLEMQAQQTAEAKTILAETGGQMEMITFEKKQLMQQWKTSLINLTKRDEAVAAATHQLSEAKMAMQDMSAEILGTKRETDAAQTKNESLVAVRDRFQKEDATLEEQIMKIRDERDVLTERYGMLQRSVAQTDEEEKKIDAEGQDLQSQLDTVNQNIQVVQRERQKLELKVMDQLNDRLTVDKANKNFGKAIVSVGQKVHDKEIEAANLDNEMSRIRVDTLNTDAHNVQLRDMLDKHVTDLKDKDKLIEKYQLEIRQRNDEIEKKMYRVDRLNRKYEQMVDGQEDVEHMGPLEATIRNLKKEYEKVGEESAVLQRDWLADQTNLVYTAAETEERLEKNAELRARVSILAEKKLRLSKDIVVQEAEVKRLDHAIKSMHGDMQRLNELISKNSKLQLDLQNTNSILEMEFVNELKELEHSSITLETQLQEKKEAKANLLDEIMETERQLLLWEKKIQLEKETQAALDPNVGMSENQAMEKEIHRMRVRYSKLKSEQDVMVQEMERAVHKHEAINLRYQGKKQAEAGKKKGKVEGISKAQLNKKITESKKLIKKTAHQAAEYNAAIDERKLQINQISALLEEETARYGQLEDRLNDLQTTINGQLFEKQRHTEILGRKQKSLKRYQALERGTRTPLLDAEAPRVEEDLDIEENKARKIKGLLGDLGEKFTHLSDVLSRVSQLADDQ